MEDIRKEEIKTGEEYTKFVREFVTLLDRELSVLEERVEKKEDIRNIARRMPAIISLVNTVGYLRGQDNVFLKIRPSTENQREFYNYENLFEDRLNKIIEFLLDSEEKDFYIEILESYLVKVRSGQKTDMF
jgi:hypothetical protein